jgi:hypothetical protein
MDGRRVAVFDFSGIAPYRDSAAHVPNLDWTPTRHATTAGAAAITPQAWLESEGAAADMARRIRESNAFSLRIVCAADATREGRARIVSNSLDGDKRNFSLEQRGDDLVFRWRTPHTGENASHPEAVVPGVFMDDQPRHILVTYDGATLRTAIANTGLVHSVALTPGSSLAAVWVPYLPASKIQIYTLGYVTLLFVPAGLWVGIAVRHRRDRLVWSALWVFGFTAMLEATLMLTSGRSIVWGNVWTTAVMGGLVMATAMASAPTSAPCPTETH